MSARPPPALAAWLLPLWLAGCATSAPPPPPPRAQNPTTPVLILAERPLAPPSLAARVWLALSGTNRVPPGAGGFELLVQTADGTRLACIARAGLGIGATASLAAGMCLPAGS